MRVFKLVLVCVLACAFWGCKAELPNALRATTSPQISFKQPIFAEFSGVDLREIYSNATSVKVKINGKPHELKAKITASSISFEPFLRAKSSYEFAFNAGEIPVKFSVKTAANKLELSKTSFNTTALDADFSFELNSAFDLEESDFFDGASLTIAGEKLGFKSVKKRGSSWLVTSEKFALTNETSRLKVSFDKTKFGLDAAYEELFATPVAGQLWLQKAFSEEDEFVLEFSHLLDAAQNAAEFVTITPQTPLKARIALNQIRLSGEFSDTQVYELKVSPSLRAKEGFASKQEFSASLAKRLSRPQILFSEAGIFLPSQLQKRIAFKSRNVNKVKLTIHKIYSNNIAQYLRDRSFTHATNAAKYQTLGWWGEGIEFVGDEVFSKEFELEKGVKNLWQQNEIWLENLRDKAGRSVELDSVFVVSLSFDEGGCEYDFSQMPNWKKQQWFEQNAQISKNIIFSNLAISAEAADEEIFVNVRDFTTLKGVSNANITAISRKNQPLASVLSDENGSGVLKTNYKDVLFLVAQSGNETSFLKLDSPLLLDGFDTAGEVKNSLTKAFIYTERGIYRPGDEVHFSVVALHNQTPLSHPITLTLKDSRGNTLLQEAVLQPQKHGFFYHNYTLDLAAPTGEYTAVFKVASQQFKHSFKVGSFTPNRIDVKIASPKIFGDKGGVNVSANYLFGAPAANLRANLRLNFVKKEFANPKFKDYIFTNPTLYAASESLSFNAKLDENGFVKTEFEIPQKIKSAKNANFNALINAEVFEDGGRSTLSTSVAEVRNFEYFIGVKRLKENFVKKGEKLKFELIASGVDGELLSGKKLKWRVFQNRHSWWQDYDSFEQFLRFIKRQSYSTLVAQGEVLSAQNPVAVEFDCAEFSGDMFFEVEEESGVSAAQSFYISSYGEPAQSDITSTLQLRQDKPSYAVGETAKITFEASKNARAFVALSGAQGVFKRFEVVLKEGQNSFEVPILEEFAPNVYASVTLLQEYQSWQNDKSLRLFGVANLAVQNPQKKLNLTLSVPSKVLPNGELEVELQSGFNRQFSYTLAVVDEGLLSVDGFKTPDILAAFLKKSGFGLRIFDTYSQVVAKHSGKIAKILTAGGERAMLASLSSRANKGDFASQTRRFQPVVLFTPPTLSDENGRAKVRLKVPNYLGELRVMAVASDGVAFGSKQASTTVSAPVVLLQTLPKITRAADEFSVLVELFRTSETASEAEVSLEAKNSLITFTPKNAKIKFENSNKTQLIFNAKVANSLGVEQLTTRLKAGEESFNTSVNISINALNPLTFESKAFALNASQSLQLPLPNDYLNGSLEAVLKLSSKPFLNLDRRVGELLSYPYGCLEQSVSRAFVQLYLDKFLFNLPRQSVVNNINAAIAKLAVLQTSDGGFAYWQGGGKSDEWGSIYAGAFLIYAKEAGFFVPDGVFQRWLKYATNKAKARSSNDFYQASLLYTLSLVKSANVAALNALYEKKESLDTLSLWQLAAAFKASGFEEVGLNLAKNLPTTLLSKRGFSDFYASKTRDEALIALAFSKIYDKPCEEIVSKLSTLLQSSAYLSTQSSAYALLAVADATGAKSLQQSFNATLEGTSNSTLSGEGVVSVKLNESVVLHAQTPLFATLSLSGVKQTPPAEFSKNLEITREFYSQNGTAIDPQKLESGSSFYLKISVRKTLESGRLENVALTQLLPSGWEAKEEAQSFAGQSRFDFKDVRDDKVSWFFSLQDTRPRHFYIALRAVTPGEYELSGAYAEAMYDSNFAAQTKSLKVKVVR